MTEGGNRERRPLSSDTPVAIFVYNRPDKTRQIADRLQEVQPRTLRIVADGPEKGNPKDARAVEKVRGVLEAIPWDCDLERNYAEENLGLKQRFVTGLDWLFGLGHERAIILEDDCLPDPSFFRFCERMLDEYSDDQRVWDIAGTNHLGTWKEKKQDYHFSCYGGIWGWATWKRSWEAYEPDMSGWSLETVREEIRDFIASDEQFEYVQQVYDRAFREANQTWDYPWGYSRHANRALSVVPSRNLVVNIGFGADGTHTKQGTHPLSPPSVHSFEREIAIRDRVERDRAYDAEIHELRKDSLLNKIVRRLRGVF